MAFDTFPCNPYPISKGMLEKGNNDELNTRVTALEGEVSDLNDTKANKITIAPFFSAEASYEVGDLVYYNGLTYRCTNDHEGDWDADDFAATTVSNELATLKSGLINLNNTLYGSLGLSEVSLNNYKANASYRIGNLANCTNTPDNTKTGVTGVFIIEAHGNYILQRFYGNLGESHRFSYDSGTTWETWI